MTQHTTTDATAFARHRSPRSAIPFVARFDPVAPAHRRRFPLDPVRAIAAMVVIVTHVHSNQLLTITHPSDGEVRLNHTLEVFADASVTVFFVLSAFVLYLPAARAAMAGRNSTTWKDMLLRRIVRLLPLYFIVVLVVWSATNTRLPGTWQDLLLHMSMLHVYSDRYIFWTDGPAWSLAVEFHFYVLMAIVTPLATAWAIQSHSPRIRIARMSAFPAVLAVAGVVYLMWAVRTYSHDRWSVWFGPLGMMSIFAMGMALAVAVAGGVELRSTWVRRSLALGALGVFVLVAMLRDPLNTSDQLWRLALGVASAALISSIVMTTGQVPRWLTWRPLVALGVFSYGMYLLHEPLMRFARWVGVLLPGDLGIGGFIGSAAIVLTLTIFAARFSFNYVESNAMRILSTFETGGRFREYYSRTLDTAELPDNRKLSTATSAAAGSHD